MLSPGVPVAVRELPSDEHFWLLQELVLDGGDFVESAHSLGFPSGAFRKADSRWHQEIKSLWIEGQQLQDRATSRRTLREIAADERVPPKDRNRAAELLGRSSGYIRDSSELSVSGGLEVNSPDVAAAIEQFTSRVLSLTAGGAADGARQSVTGSGEGAVGVSVGELDRAAVAGAA